MRPNIEKHPLTQNEAKKVCDCFSRSSSFLQELARHIAFRNIELGMQLLDEHRNCIQSCGPKCSNSSVVVGHLAQWVDLGFAEPALVKELLARFSTEARVELPVRDFVHLEMAEGFVAMSEQNDEAAISHLEIVLAIQNEVPDQGVTTIANFWIARCYRRLSRYQDALQYVVKARETAHRSKHFKTVAVIQVLEGWLLFQEGRTDEAAATLIAAERILFETDDFVARGNLNSTYSRIARRKGDYEEALRRSEVATEEFKKRDPKHRNLAKSLANSAFVKRLLACELSEMVDTEAAQKRKTKGRRSPLEIDIQGERERVRVLHDEATRDLMEALEISHRYNDYRAEGEVRITEGYLYLDEGDLDSASPTASAAYRLGDEKIDSVLKARARILQSAIELAKVEEQIVHGSVSRFIRLASEYAREAVELVKHTQNRQLIAQALVIRGRALLREGDLEGADNCCVRATGLLSPDIHDFSWKELRQLKSRLHAAGKIEIPLREWSRGIVGNKTFQQITNEFAAIVIPKVWEHEEGKISRVAKRLSISPKKVRRILRSQGISTTTK